jgi:biotin carboxyl carrier protein
MGRRLAPQRACHRAGAVRRRGSARAGPLLHVDVNGRSTAFSLAPPPQVDSARDALGGAAGVQAVQAPMPGVVLAIHVERGTQVREGDALVTLEAMKMEHVVAARRDGPVAEVLVQAGDQVAKGQVLVVQGAPDARDAATTSE